ncbi:DUF2332 domain-containing protein [Halosolutus halophilus]|uniref:DUF2332 domain-containing protein n=1 Tax=Halosolutus halophilus TaxID=1552990 RepID=UPI002234EEAB|nr:DUF2332 domain-containing protein [Halosolutus halophilus]
MGEISEAFIWYGDWAEEVSPLYASLARKAAQCPNLVDIAAEARDGQPPPQLLLAAVHALVLEEPDHRIAEFYPSCTDDPLDPSDADPFPAFREFCLTHEGRVREIVATRRVQTNDVGRSAVLFPAFAHAARTGVRRPLALVEVGTSAGLNLYWDRFQYAYDEYGTHGESSSPVRIESAVKGAIDPPLSASIPDVEYRAGIDLQPLDVTDPSDKRWLRALAIPDQQWRYDRLAAAIELVADDPPRLVEGDVPSVLPDLLPEVPVELELCIFSTHTLYQFEESAVAEFENVLREFSRERPLYWFSDTSSSESEYPNYRMVTLRDGVSEETHLAEYKSYGEWIRWLAAE